MSRKPPLKKARDFQRTRAEFLKVAFLEVFVHGFQGVSIDTIVAKTKLTKGAFYHHFPTKLDLGYALVDDVIKPMIIERWILPLAKFENPVEGILDQLQNLIGKAKPEQLRLGCPLNNLVQEMAPLDSGFKKRLRTALLFWIEGMDSELVRAKNGGYLKKSVNTRQLAYYIVMCHEGFYGMLKGLDDSEIPEAFDALYSSLLTSVRNLFSSEAGKSTK